LDAGFGPDDQRARSTQLDEVARAIAAESHGRPIVIGGDFNLRRDDAVEGDLMVRLAERAGLSDTGAQAIDTRHWQRLDWILFRGTPGVSVEVVDSGEDLRFMHEGVPLSDHPALHATLRVARRHEDASAFERLGSGIARRSPAGSQTTATPID